MGDKTGISWTDATWNPIRGCSRVSQGCVHCYAEGVAKRFSGPDLPYEGLVDSHGRWNGTIRVVEHLIDQPLRWQRGRRIFVNSMSDLFHENVDQVTLDRIFAVMAQAGRHTFQVLTKRSDRMRRYLTDPGTPQRIADLFDPEWRDGRRGALPFDWPLRNVHLGVSVEDQSVADTRVPDLVRTPAAVRFLSAEPLLGDIDVRHWIWGDRCPDPQCGDSTWDHACELGAQRLHWVIAGSESGAGARLAEMMAFRSLRIQCQDAGVAFFAKQLPIRGRTTTELEAFPDDMQVRQFPEVPRG